MGTVNQREVSQGALVQVELKPITCGECGIAFGISERRYQELVESHDMFYCPNGHRRHFVGESDVQRAQRLQQEAEKRAEWLRKQRDAAERRRRAAVGQVTKIKNRINHGICPCCKRTFKQLAKHMACKHPEYLKEG